MFIWPSGQLLGACGTILLNLPPPENLIKALYNPFQLIKCQLNKCSLQVNLFANDYVLYRRPNC